MRPIIWIFEFVLANDATNLRTFSTTTKLCTSIRTVHRSFSVVFNFTAGGILSLFVSSLAKAQSSRSNSSNWRKIRWTRDQLSRPRAASMNRSWNELLPKIDKSKMREHYRLQNSKGQISFYTSSRWRNGRSSISIIKIHSLPCVLSQLSQLFASIISKYFILLTQKAVLDIYLFFDFLFVCLFLFWRVVSFLALSCPAVFNSEIIRNALKKWFTNGSLV